MSNQNLKKGIAKIGYAMVTDSTKFEYDKVVWLESERAGGREYSAEPNGETTEVYADSISVYAAEDNNGYDINLILLAIIDDIETKWLGNYATTSGGVVEAARPETRPKFALIMIEETTNGNGETTIYYNCCVSKRPKKSGKTSEGKFEPQFPEFAIAARPRPTDKWVRATLPQKEEFATIPDVEIKKPTTEPTTEPEGEQTEPTGSEG